MSKFKRIITNWRVVTLLLAVLLAIWAIQPNPWADGVVIKAVEKNSSAMNAGIQSPTSSMQPLDRERVLSVNGQDIHSVTEYYDAVSNLRINQTVQLRTTKFTYQLKVLPEFSIDAKNKSVMTAADLGLSVDEAPVTNLRKGLDLQGGTRVVLKPAENVSEEMLGLLVDSLNQRLNVYGLSDILITTIGGTLGQQDLIVVEIAGATVQEVSDLVQQQGKFEATIGNTTVFVGGNNDVTYVCRTAECSGLDPQRGCGQVEGGWACGYRFQISLSPEAAERQANTTRSLSVIGTGTNRYLSQPLELYLDDELVRSLNIGADLRGQAATEIVISGSGSGLSYDAALENTFQDMKTLQTVMITGSLPVKLDVVKIDTISPSLGSAFIKNALLLALLSTVAVAIVLTAIYRRFAITIPIILTAVFEITLVLGIASVLRWQLDLASIAGLIIAIGTGVNDQIIITDEALRKEASGANSLKDRIKRALFVVMAAYFTNAVAMLALWFFGAGLLKGFAVTTILAVTVGVLVTRPAYAAIVNMLIEE